MSKFALTSNKGFHMTFANGWTVSIQWGPGNYCDNYNDPIEDIGKKARDSSQAECWAWGEDGEPLAIGKSEYAKDGIQREDVLGHKTADEVLAYMVEVSRRQPQPKAEV